MARNYGSKREFNKYRTQELSYTLPTIKQTVSYPYLVVNDGVYGKYFTTITSYLDVLQREREQLQQLLELLIETEQAKEQRFIIAYKTSLPEAEKEFLQYLERLPNINQQFEAIQLRRDQLLDLQKTYEENIVTFSNQYGDIQNRYFIDQFSKAVYEAVHGTNGSMSVFNKQLDLDASFDDVLNTMKELVQNNLKAHITPAYAKVVNETFNAFRDSILDTLETKGLASSTSLRTYFNILDKNAKSNQNKIFARHDVKTKKGTKMIRATNLKTAVQSLAASLAINGLFEETYRTRNNGIRVGDVKTTYTDLNNNASVGKIQTDAYELFNMKVEVDLDAEEKIKQLLKESSGQMTKEIQKALNFYSQKGFVVSYSMKDLYKYSTERRATIRKKASFAERLSTLREIGDSLGLASTEQLIFDIVNVTQGMVNSQPNQIRAIRQALTDVCMAWMFDDYKETFEQLKSELPNNHLHIYMINGHYYLMSTILTLIKEQLLNETTHLRSIQIAFSLVHGKDNPYMDIVKHQPEITGIDRWEAVREVGLNQNYITMRLNTQTLEKLVHNLKFDREQNLFYSTKHDII